MLRYKIVLTDKALEDITGIARYITEELFNREAADKLVDSFYEAITGLSIMPKRHEEITDEEFIIPEGIRHIIVENYYVFYRCNNNPDEVMVLRVLYKKREWQTLL